MKRQYTGTSWGVQAVVPVLPHVPRYKKEFVNDCSGPSERGLPAQSGAVLGGLVGPPGGAPPAQNEVIPPNGGLVPDNVLDRPVKGEGEDSCSISPGKDNFQNGRRQMGFSIQLFKGGSQMMTDPFSSISCGTSLQRGHLECV